MDFFWIQRRLYHGFRRLAHPDASLVRRARFPGGQIPTKADLPPDVAFEIHSPSDTPSYIQRKRKDYKESGVIQVWLDLEKRLVELIYPDRPLQYFVQDQILAIDTVPNFSLHLKQPYSISIWLPSNSTETEVKTWTHQEWLS